MPHLFKFVFFSLLLLLSACTMPHEISNALYDRETDELLQNTAAEYIVHASIGGEEASWLNQRTAEAIQEQMKLLEIKLEALLGDDEVATIRQPDEGILIVIPSDVIFKSGRGDLREGVDHYLEGYSFILSQYPAFQTYILVHTDNNGSEYMSLALSEERAKVLRKSLKKTGLKHVHTEGKGALVPIITNESEEGRKLNRRVEIAIVASTKLIKQTKKDIKRDNRKSNN